MRILLVLTLKLLGERLPPSPPSDGSASITGYTGVYTRSDRMV